MRNGMYDLDYVLISIKVTQFKHFMILASKKAANKFTSSVGKFKFNRSDNISFHVNYLGI